MAEQELELHSLTHLVRYGKNTQYRVQHFDCGIEEYNAFLNEEANKMRDQGLSNTRLLLSNESADIIGYFCLCMGSIKPTKELKTDHKMEHVSFNVYPVLKIGKLAIDRKYRGKGYGSFLLQIIRGIAKEISLNYVACRFIVADVDIQYDKENFIFYQKNGFEFLQSIEKAKTAVTMCLDILDNDFEIEESAKSNSA